MLNYKAQTDKTKDSKANKLILFVLPKMFPLNGQQLKVVMASHAHPRTHKSEQPFKTPPSTLA